MCILAAAVTSGCAPAPEAPGGAAERIIAVAPNIVEILFELGLGERVVGVGDHCAFPPAAAAKPKIGGLLDPRFEAIAALEPDLAILLPSEEALSLALRRLGVEVLVTPVESLRDVAAAIETIAQRTGRVMPGRALVELLEMSFAERRQMTGLSALLVVGRQPGDLSDIFVAGEKTFLHELLAFLGVANAVADSPLRYPQVGLEEVSVRRPQVILELQPDELGEEARRMLIEDWRRNLPGLDACVVVLEGDHVLIPGPRVGRLYSAMAEGIERCGAVS